MKNAPPLEEGEEILFDHVPSLRAFKRTAILMLALTLPAVVAFSVVFPDTVWPAVPLFVACVLLMQERVTLGRHSAWVTNQRIILQGGQDVPLWDVSGAVVRGKGVRVAVAGHPRKGMKLVYSDNPAALAHVIETARKARV